MAYTPTTGNGSALAAQNRGLLFSGNGMFPWLTANSIPLSRGMISEMGIPGSSNPVIDPNYDPGFTLTLQQLFLDFNANNIHVTLWSGGEWRIDLAVFLNVDGSNKALNYRSTTSSVLLLNKKGQNGVTAGRGFNLWGAEASDTGPSGGLNGGVLYGQYYFPQTADFAALASVGITELRFPYRMERLQPTLLGPLNTSYLAGIQQALTDANTYGIKLYLDPHNYGRYDTNAATNTSGSTSGVYMLGQNAPSSVGGTMQAAFVDHMVKLVNATKGYAGLWGWGLNNEPHDLPNGNTDWFAYCRAAVEAIRLNDQTHYIFVGGYNYQGAGAWLGNNGANQWLTETIPTGQANAGQVRGLADPLIIWDGHQYYDYDGTYSGSGSSFSSLNQAAINAGFAPYNNGQPPAALDITSQVGDRQVYSADQSGPGIYTAAYPNSNTLAFTILGGVNILKVTTTATQDEGAYRQTLDTAHLGRGIVINFGLPVGANLSTTNDYTIFHAWNQNYYSGSNISDLVELRVIGATGGYKVKITQPSGSYPSVTGTTIIPYSNTQLHSIKLVVTDTGFATYIDGSTSADANMAVSNTGQSMGGLDFGKFYGTSYVGDMYYGPITVTSPGASYDAPPNGGLFYTPSTTTTTTTTSTSTSTTTTTTTIPPTTTTTTTVPPTTTTTTIPPTTTTTTTQSGYRAYSGFVGVASQQVAAIPNLVGFTTSTAPASFQVQTKYRGDLTAGAVTIPLPTMAAVGDRILIEKIDTSTNYLTFTGNIDGTASSSISIKTKNEAKLLEWAGSTWIVTATSLSVTTLDARYATAGAVWGGITGTLSNQTDLQSALNAKANTSSLATVATTGAYSDLTGKPTIPAAGSYWDTTTNQQVGGIKTIITTGSTWTTGSVSRLQFGDSASFIQNTYGGNTVWQSGATNMVVNSVTGNILLQYNGSNILATSSTGVSVTGNMIMNATGTATSTTSFGSSPLSIQGSSWNSSTSAATQHGWTVTNVLTATYGTTSTLLFQEAFGTLTGSSANVRFIGRDAGVDAINVNDNLGTRIMETYQTGYIGMTSSGGAAGLVPAGGWAMFLAMSYNGKVGTITPITSAAAPTWRNVIDDGTGASVWAPSLTGSSSFMNGMSLNVAVNQSGTASYNGLLMNVTETAVGSGNKRLADLQVGGISRFTVDNQGNTSLGVAGGTNSINFIGSIAQFQIAGSNQIVFNGASGKIALGGTSTGNATAILANYGLTGASVNQAILTVSGTVSQTGTSGYTGLLVNVTESTTGSGAKLIADLQVGGSSKFSVRNDGFVTLTNQIYIPNNTGFILGGGTGNQSTVKTGTDGTFLFDVGSGVNSRFKMGGTTSSNYIDFTPDYTNSYFKVAGDKSVRTFNSILDDGAGNATLVGLAGTGTRMVVASSTGALSTQAIPSGSGNTANIYTNTMRFDQSPSSGGTYGTLVGTINGTNTVFTVSNGSYAAGSLNVVLNGVDEAQGASYDWTETAPGSGTFTFTVAPPTGATILVQYLVPSSSTGNVPQPYRAVTAATTVTASDKYLELNATSAAISQPMPSVTAFAGFEFVFMKTDSSANTVTLTGTFNGVTNYVLATQGKFVRAYSNGVEWKVVGNN